MTCHQEFKRRLNSSHFEKPFLFRFLRAYDSSAVRDVGDHAQISEMYFPKLQSCILQSYNCKWTFNSQFHCLQMDCSLNMSMLVR